MVVKIKDIRLPDAPAPTRAYKETPEWERKLYESLQRRTEPPKRRNYSRWTDKEINTMKKMWLEGYIAKDIAPHVGGNIRATQNKLTWFSRPTSTKNVKDNLAEDMCTADGHLDMTNPKTKILLDLIERLSSWDNWLPQEDVYLTHCKDDNFIPYAQAEKFYEQKKASSKMHFKDVSSKPLDSMMGAHAASTAMDIIIAILHEEPADSYKYLP